MSGMFWIALELSIRKIEFNIVIFNGLLPNMSGMFWIALELSIRKIEFNIVIFNG